MEETIDALLGRSTFLTVKDSSKGKPQFLLPGDVIIDSTRYFQKVKAAGWKSLVLVEVSRQIQTLPGYDPAQAARRSYAHLAPILKSLGFDFSASESAAGRMYALAAGIGLISVTQGVRAGRIEGLASHSTPEFAMVSSWPMNVERQVLTSAARKRNSCADKAIAAILTCSLR
jgi:hypothetical protein